MNNYFQTAKVKAPKPSEHVLLYSYSNIMSEVEEVAKQIKTLVRDKGYRYNDISVLTGNIELYKIYISAIFSEYGIAYFLDAKRSINTNPLVSMIVNLLEVITSSWSYKSMMALLKSDMLPINKADVDYVENYILAQGINRKYKWQKVWEFGDKTWDYDRLNDIREQVIAMLSIIENKLNGKIIISEATIAVYEFLESMFRL